MFLVLGRVCCGPVYNCHNPHIEPTLRQHSIIVQAKDRGNEFLKLHVLQTMKSYNNTKQKLIGE